MENDPGPSNDDIVARLRAITDEITDSVEIPEKAPSLEKTDILFARWMSEIGDWRRGLAHIHLDFEQSKTIPPEKKNDTEET